MHIKKFAKKIKHLTSGLLAGVLTCCLTGLAACKAPEAADSGRLEIVASFAPVYALTLTIAEGADNLSVSCMAANSTGCLHDYQITADDMKRVEKADLYIIGGAGMEGSFLDKITAQYKALTVADSSEGALLLKEKITVWSGLGMLLILGSILLPHFLKGDKRHDIQDGSV
mgnify:CR=1 FL=1